MNLTFKAAWSIHRRCIRNPHVEKRPNSVAGGWLCAGSAIAGLLVYNRAGTMVTGIFDSMFASDVGFFSCGLNFNDE